MADAPNLPGSASGGEKGSGEVSTVAEATKHKTVTGVQEADDNLEGTAGGF